MDVGDENIHDNDSSVMLVIVMTMKIVIMMLIAIIMLMALTNVTEKIIRQVMMA